jgi:hypothetical protein
VDGYAQYITKEELGSLLEASGIKDAELLIIRAQMEHRVERKATSPTFKREVISVLYCNQRIHTSVLKALRQMVGKKHNGVEYFTTKMDKAEHLIRITPIYMKHRSHFSPEITAYHRPEGLSRPWVPSATTIQQGLFLLIKTTSTPHTLCEEYEQNPPHSPTVLIPFDTGVGNYQKYLPSYGKAGIWVLTDALPDSQRLRIGTEDYTYGYFTAPPMYYFDTMDWSPGAVRHLLQQSVIKVPEEHQGHYRSFFSATDVTSTSNMSARKTSSRETSYAQIAKSNKVEDERKADRGPMNAGTYTSASLFSPKDYISSMAPTPRGLTQSGGYKYDFRPPSTRSSTPTDFSSTPSQGRMDRMESRLEDLTSMVTQFIQLLKKDE